MGCTSPPPPPFRPALVYSHKETLNPAIKRSRHQKRKFRLLEPASAEPPIQPTQRPHRALTPAPGVTSLSNYIHFYPIYAKLTVRVICPAGLPVCPNPAAASGRGDFFCARTPRALEKIAPRHQKHTAACLPALFSSH